MSLINLIFKKLIPWNQEKDFHLDHATARRDATFELRYKGKLIGTLRHKNGKWYFSYSDEYKQKPFVTPLANFPKIDKDYVFDELPPFFATRIPALNQPYHQKKLAKYKADKNDLVALLEIFGRRSINNPFELIKT